MTAMATDRPFTGRKMLYWIVGFFAVVIAANLVMMAFALRTHTGLVVPNSYVASQDFNRTIADARAQAALGWRTGLAYGDGVIETTFEGPDGAAIQNLRVTGVVGRPVSAVEDKAVVFREVAPGVYWAEVDLAPGEWRLTSKAAGAGDRPYHERREFFVPGPAK